MARSVDTGCSPWVEIEAGEGLGGACAPNPNILSAGQVVNDPKRVYGAWEV